MHNGMRFSLSPTITPWRSTCESSPFIRARVRPNMVPNSSVQCPGWGGERKNDSRETGIQDGTSNWEEGSTLQGARERMGWHRERSFQATSKGGIHHRGGCPRLGNVANMGGSDSTTERETLVVTLSTNKSSLRNFQQRVLHFLPPVRQRQRPPSIRQFRNLPRRLLRSGLLDPCILSVRMTRRPSLQGIRWVSTPQGRNWRS